MAVNNEKLLRQLVKSDTFAELSPRNQSRVLKAIRKNKYDDKTMRKIEKKLQRDKDFEFDFEGAQRRQAYAAFNYQKRRAKKFWNDISDYEKELYTGTGNKYSYVMDKPAEMDYTVRNKLKNASMEEIEVWTQNLKDWADEANSKNKRLEKIARDQLQIIADSLDMEHITREEAIENITIIVRNAISAGMKPAQIEAIVQDIFFDIALDDLDIKIK